MSPTYLGTVLIITDKYSANIIKPSVFSISLVVQNRTLIEKMNLTHTIHNIRQLDIKQNEMAAIVFQMIWKTIK